MVEVNTMERLPSGWLRQIRMTIWQQRFSSKEGGSGASGTGSGRPKERTPRLAVPRLRGVVPASRQPTGTDSTNYGPSPRQVRDQNGHNQIVRLPDVLAVRVCVRTR